MQKRKVAHSLIENSITEGKFYGSKHETKETGIFDWYFKTSLLTRIFIALILGAIAGLVIGPEIAWINPLGVIFIRLLKMIVMPVVIFTLVVGSASIHPSRLGKIGVKALGIYIITSAFAVAIGLLFADLFSPGESLLLVGTAGVAGKILQTPSLIIGVFTSICFSFLLFFLTSFLLHVGKPAPTLITPLYLAEIFIIPYEFMSEEETPTGYTVDLTNATAKVMSVKVEIRLGPWNQMRNALENGEIDALQGMVFTDERKKIYEFTPPHAIISSALKMIKTSCAMP